MALKTLQQQGDNGMLLCVLCALEEPTELPSESRD